MRSFGENVLPSQKRLQYDANKGQRLLEDLRRRRRQKPTPLLLLRVFYTRMAIDRARLPSVHHPARPAATLRRILRARAGQRWSAQLLMLARRTRRRSATRRLDAKQQKQRGRTGGATRERRERKKCRKYHEYPLVYL